MCPSYDVKVDVLTLMFSCHVCCYADIMHKASSSTTPTTTTTAHADAKADASEAKDDASPQRQGSGDDSSDEDVVDVSFAGDNPT